MLSCAKPICNHLARVVIYCPPKPELMLFVSVKTPHLIHFNPCFTAFAMLDIHFIDMTEVISFFLIPQWRYFGWCPVAGQWLAHLCRRSTNGRWLSWHQVCRHCKCIRRRTFCGNIVRFCKYNVVFHWRYRSFQREYFRKKDKPKKRRPLGWMKVKMSKIKQW